MRLSPISLVLALALAGCAAKAPLNPASQVTGLIELPVESSRSIHLPAAMQYTVPGTASDAGGNGKQFSLIAGNYRPYKYNQAGTFYLGEQPAIVERNPAAPGAVGTFLRIGGIWIPADPAAAPKLFILPEYYTQLDDGAPVPQKMTATNLAGFRHEVPPAVRTPIIVVPAVVPGTARLITPLQAGLIGAVAGGVFALINGPDAPRELAFVTSAIDDPAAVRQIRSAFAPGVAYVGI